MATPNWREQRLAREFQQALGTPLPGSAAKKYPPRELAVAAEEQARDAR